jgi:hypothetical protein
MSRMSHSLRSVRFIGGALAIACAFAASAGARPADPEEVLSKYEKTGETTTCLSLMTIRRTDVVDDYAMLVSTGRDTYINEMKGRCVGLRRESRYVHEATTGKMCNGDIIRVLDSFGGFRGSCTLGDFEKVIEIPEEGEAE